MSWSNYYNTMLFWFSYYDYDVYVNEDFHMFSSRSNFISYVNLNILSLFPSKTSNAKDKKQSSSIQYFWWQESIAHLTEGKVRIKWKKSLISVLHFTKRVHEEKTHLGVSIARWLTVLFIWLVKMFPLVTLIPSLQFIFSCITMIKSASFCLPTPIFSSAVGTVSYVLNPHRQMSWFNDSWKFCH